MAKPSLSSPYLLKMFDFDIVPKSAFNIKIRGFMYLNAVPHICLLSLSFVVQVFNYHIDAKVFFV